MYAHFATSFPRESRESRREFEGFTGKSSGKMAIILTK